MNYQNMSPDIGQDVSQPSHQRPGSRQSTIEPIRSRSNTAVTTRAGRHVRSRGSTASIQSNTTQYIPEQKQQPAGYQPYMHAEAGQNQHLYHSNPEEMILRFGDQFANSNSGTVFDPALQDIHNSARPRADSHFQGHEVPGHPIPVNGLTPDFQPHGMPGDMHAHYAAVYDGVENQMPDQIMGDNDGSEAGPRKRKGATSTIANDNELRRLLRQYDGFTLKQMAGEVQKHEGTGGKSEKAKQVFAMIWLRENCQRTTGSVRRDRVYCCYAETCGSERVTLLNPASFGKLVRIIFPNVQTRRLGVRGESKYHYVDLCLKESEQHTATGALGLPDIQPDNVKGKDGRASSHQQSIPPQQTDAPDSRSTTSLSPKPQPSHTSGRRTSCTCKGSDDSHLDMGVKMNTEDSILATRKIVDRLLLFVPQNEPSPIDNDSLHLPNIHQYIPPHTDVDIADALAALYRSHCISVIDSFRYCKEKNLFRYFTSFQGTLTVPVQKLLVHPDLAPWIRECDWVMYQKMIACVSPLTTQVVPDAVLATFKSISRKLVSHIQDTLKSHPEHVSSARLIPARVFCHLVKRLLDVNQAANSAAVWLCRVDYRNKMWEDFSHFIDPVDIVSSASVPRCSVQAALEILRDQVKALLSPVGEESPEVQLFDGEDGSKKFTYSSTSADEYENFPDRWISFILSLQETFPNHSAKCIIEKTDALWTSVLHRLTLVGAQSFSAWWMTKVFFLEMMLWQAERGGFANSTSRLIFAPPADPDTSEKPSDPPNVDVRPDPSAPTNGHSRRETSNAANGKRNPDVPVNNRNSNNDDSAIDLEDDSVLVTGQKYGDMTASDPADADGDVVVI